MIALSEWKKQARSLEAGGRRFAYWTSAEHDETKPWLLLIHGYPTSSWDWNFIWPRLAVDFRLAAIDMLGFGLSEKPKNIPYSIFSQADVEEALLEHLGAGEAHILAHDYGDTVAQELLARHNEGGLSFSIKSVVFLNGGLFSEQHRARPIQKIGLTPLGPLIGLLMNKNRFGKTLGEVFGSKTQASPAEIDAHWTLINENGGRFVLHKLLAYIPERRANRERWVGALQNATVPLRLIVGGADPVSGEHLYHYYRELIPHADAVLLPAIGHYPQTEAADKVMAAFREFHRRRRTIEA